MLRRILVLSASVGAGHLRAAEAVETAARDVIAEGTTVTYDLGGTAGTREFAETVATRVSR